MSRSILYDYQNGISVDRCTFPRNTSTSTESQLTLSRERLDWSDVDGDVAHIEEYLRGQSEQRLYRALAVRAGVQRVIQFGVINQERESDDGQIYPYHFQWGGSFNNLVGQREMAVLGAMYPNKHFLAINTPGAGGTDRLPWAVTKQIAKTGSFLPYGEFVAPAVNSVFNDYDGVQLLGDSQGARLSLSMAPYLDRVVTGGVLNDPVGTEYLGQLGIAQAFMMREAGHNAKYAEASFDRDSAELQAENDKPAHFLRVMGQLLISGGVIDQFLMQPRALGQPGLEHDLWQTLPYISKELVINTPEYSELTPSPEKVRDILARMALWSNRPALTQNVIRGRTHSYPSANPAVRASALMNWQQGVLQSNLQKHDTY